MSAGDQYDVLVVGAGPAGLSAAIYLGRARRRTCVIDFGKSMAVWEPDIQNYPGFPWGISGEKLLERMRRQAARCKIDFVHDTIVKAARAKEGFVLTGKAGRHRGRRVLIATGLYHLPPQIPAVRKCLGQSMFFCKDCDGQRVRGKRIAVVGTRNEAVRYALGLLVYSPTVIVATNGKEPAWDRKHSRWLEEYEIPVWTEKICGVKHDDGMMEALRFAGGEKVLIDALFTVRGDIFHNGLAEQLGAKMDPEGQVKVNADGETSVRGLYAAGCVTPENCQVVISAGGGATAAQAINSDLFDESLKNHQLERFREKQLAKEKTVPEVVPPGR